MSFCAGNDDQEKQSLAESGEQKSVCYTIKHASLRARIVMGLMLVGSVVGLAVYLASALHCYSHPNERDCQTVNNGDEYGTTMARGAFSH